MSDKNISYSTSKGTLTNHVQSLDGGFVIFGMQGGQPKVWTSAPDERQTRELLARTAPQLLSDLPVS